MTIKFLLKVLRMIREPSYGLIFVSGRGASGKSTIAEKISRDLGFKLISLDEIIRHEFDGNFQLYSQGDEFIQRIRELIDQHKYCVIEGMIQSNLIIKQIFHGYMFTFCYIKPRNIIPYLERIRTRFIESPGNYGRLGFLRKCEARIGLKDYEINGINGHEISQIIDQSGKTEIEVSNKFCAQYQRDFQVMILSN